MTTDPVDTHDPAGYAGWLRERAKANRDIALLPREEWPYRPAVLRHWAFRFEQGATLIECLDGDKRRLLGILKEVRAAVRDVDLMLARDDAGQYTNLLGRIDAELHVDVSGSNSTTENSDG